MAKIKTFDVVPASQIHVDFMTGNLREDDENECYALSHVSADDCLQIGLDTSEKVWTALRNEKPIFMFGVVPNPMISYSGIVWLLGTNEVKKAKMFLLRISKKYIKEMLESYDIIENYVDIRNTISMNWLKWCGFTIEEPSIYGPEKLYFSRFYMKKRGL